MTQDKVEVSDNMKKKKELDSFLQKKKKKIKGMIFKMDPRRDDSSCYMQIY